MPEEEKKVENQQSLSSSKTDPTSEPAEPVSDPTNQPKADDPTTPAKLELKAGMTVRVHEKIKDISPKGEERERIQVFEGIILAIRGAGISKTMTVRKVSNGYGVEKIYPINSPIVKKVELVKTARTRRAKLWFLTNPKKRFRRKLKEVWVKK